MKSFYGQIALVLTALIWGTAFSAQKTGLEALSPGVFNACRQVPALLALLPVIAVLDLLNGKRLSFFGTAETAERRNLLRGGTVCGLVLAAASLLQQYGMQYVQAGKAGFLTSLYLVMVPVIGLFFHRNPGRRMWLAAVLAFGGTCLLSGSGSWGAFGKGDLLLIGCAFGFALHITVIDRFAAKADPVRLSWIQFFVTGLVSAGVGLAAGDSFAWSGIRQAGLPLLYCGVCSSGIAFTLQTVGQKTVPPIRATLLMSLESVFSVLGGWIILHEHLSLCELTGCAVIFAAVLLAQVPVVKSGKKV